jgi:hypothetical protein
MCIEDIEYSSHLVVLVGGISKLLRGRIQPPTEEACSVGEYYEELMVWPVSYYLQEVSPSFNYSTYMKYAKTICLQIYVKID